MLSHFSLERNHDLDDRIASAGAAGFAGIGLFAGQWIALADDGWSPSRLGDALDTASICLAEIEVLAHWGRAAPTEEQLAFEAVVWSLVDIFESRYVQAIGSYDGSIRDAAVRFGALCDRAADHGAVVGLEFLPFTNIVDARDAQRIVEEAGRPNGGVCVDIWHHVRGADDVSLLEAIPGELITGVQMSDGPRRAPDAGSGFDYRDDCLRHRVPPGLGEFDVTGFVDLLRAKGVDVPWGLEVCNESAWGRPAHDHVHAVARGMRSLIG
ncbi:MAG: TIM barrel protein [Ilumatobacter sp.]|uniref:sugar phosphate isomerase/epimerase family protein n=1 Tax=Ilumatobacter sp. TaxID=1967498 RepID=UPI00329A7887